MIEPLIIPNHHFEVDDILQILQQTEGSIKNQVANKKQKAFMDINDFLDWYSDLADMFVASFRDKVTQDYDNKKKEILGRQVKKIDDLVDDYCLALGWDKYKLPYGDFANKANSYLNGHGKDTKEALKRLTDITKSVFIDSPDDDYKRHRITDEVFGFLDEHRHSINYLLGQNPAETDINPDSEPNLQISPVLHSVQNMEPNGKMGYQVTYQYQGSFEEAMELDKNQWLSYITKMASTPGILTACSRVSTTAHKKQNINRVLRMIQEIDLLDRIDEKLDQVKVEKEKQMKSIRSDHEEFKRRQNSEDMHLEWVKQSYADLKAKYEKDLGSYFIKPSLGSYLDRRLRKDLIHLTKFEIGLKREDHLPAARFRMYYKPAYNNVSVQIA